MSELTSPLVRAFGGRVGEELRYDGGFSTAAEDDMREATVLASEMATKWGRSELGPANLASLEVAMAREGLASSDFSGSTAARVDAAVAELLERSMAVARNHLSASRVALDELARALITQETLSAEEISVIQSDLPAGGLVDGDARGQRSGSAS